MALICKATLEGLTAADQAEADGFKVSLTRFSVSETKGLLDDSRTYANRTARWYEGAINSITTISPGIVEYQCVIPTGSNGGVPIAIGDIYVEGQRADTSWFLFAVCQVNIDTTFDPSGNTTLTIRMDLTGINAYEYNFVTTCAEDIAAHEVSSGFHVQNKFDAIVPPTADDDFDDGYGIGSVWVDLVGKSSYTCVKSDVGFAVWKSGGGGIVTRYTAVGDGIKSAFTATDFVEPGFSYLPGQNVISAYLGGVYQHAASFSETDATTVTFDAIIDEGVAIEITVLSPASVSGAEYARVFNVVGDGSKVAFTNGDFDEPNFSYAQNLNAIEVFFDGILQDVGDFVETNSATITFDVAPPLDVEVTVRVLGAIKLADAIPATEKGVANGVPTLTAQGLVEQKNALHDAINARKNLIIDGGFKFWFEGTSQTSFGYGSDTMSMNDHTGSTKLHTRQDFTVGQADVVGNPKYFSRTVVSSVAGANNNCLKRFLIEDVSMLSGEQVTFSFWGKADSAKNVAFEFVQEFNASPKAPGLATTLIPLTTEWQRFQHTFVVPDITGKVLAAGHHSKIQIWFDAGVNMDHLTSSLGQQSGTFDIANVQLERGDVMTDFEWRSEGEELALVNRYVQLHYLEYSQWVSGVATGMGITALLGVPMRAAATVTKSGLVSLINATGMGVYTVVDLDGRAIGMSYQTSGRTATNTHSRAFVDVFLDARL